MNWEFTRKKMIGFEYYDCTRYRGSTGIHREHIMDIFAATIMQQYQMEIFVSEEKGENRRKKREPTKGT